MITMKKICFITTVSLTIKSFLIDFSTYLVENHNYDVTFICDEDESLYDYCDDNIHYIPVNMKRGLDFNFYKIIKQLTRIFKDNQFDIIQYSTPNASLYASIAARIAGCENRLYCQWGIRYMGFDPGFKHFLFKMLERITCESSTSIECESRSLLEFSLKEKLYDEKKGYVVWNGSACGVNLSKFDLSTYDKDRAMIRSKLGIPDSSVVFSFAGRLTRDKGINELLNAFKTVHDTNNEACLLLIGKLDSNALIDTELLCWAKESPSVCFVDWTQEIEKYYCATDVFVSLSYREGFGLVVIEAAAMKKPSIVSDCPGQVDTIIPKVDGILVPTKSVCEVVNAMSYYLNNKDMINVMGENARRHVEEKYDQMILFEKMANIRDSLVD